MRTDDTPSKTQDSHRGSCDDHGKSRISVSTDRRWGSRRNLRYDTETDGAVLPISGIGRVRFARTAPRPFGRRNVRNWPIRTVPSVTDGDGGGGWCGRALTDFKIVECARKRRTAPSVVVSVPSEGAQRTGRIRARCGSGEATAGNLEPSRSTKHGAVTVAQPPRRDPVSRGGTEEIPSRAPEEKRRSRRRTARNSLKFVARVRADRAKNGASRAKTWKTDRENRDPGWERTTQIYRRPTGRRRPAAPYCPGNASRGACTHTETRRVVALDRQRPATNCRCCDSIRRASRASAREFVFSISLNPP